MPAPRVASVCHLYAPSSSFRAGEVAEWKAELVDRHKQKDALKKIIAAMTIGKDVSSVFAEVTSCSQTADLEVKKLVYLYLINYAKSQPELAILAVNTFVKVRMCWLILQFTVCLKRGTRPQHCAGLQ